MVLISKFSTCRDDRVKKNESKDVYGKQTLSSFAAVSLAMRELQCTCYWTRGGTKSGYIAFKPVKLCTYSFDETQHPLIPPTPVPVTHLVNMYRYLDRIASERYQINLLAI